MRFSATKQWCGFFCTEIFKVGQSKCNRRRLADILRWYHLILTRLSCIAIKQGTVRIEYFVVFSLIKKSEEWSKGD